MSIVKDIIQIIENVAPLSYQESYDNAGLICGDVNMDVHSILICIDITEDVIDEAIQGGHDMIISHHPLIFKPLKNILPNNYIGRTLIKSIRHNLNLYAAHTNLDAVIEGVNGKIAEKIGLINCRILQPSNDGHLGVGSGLVGELTVAEEVFSFLQRIKTTFECGIIRHTTPISEKVKRIAICGGSGSFLIKEAISANADIFITGDIKYHDFFLTENKIIIADIGHYESEQFTKEVFYNLLTKKKSNFAVQFSKTKTNPIKYL